MTRHFTHFFVKAQDNGSLFVGANFRVVEETEEQEELIAMAHEALKESSVDVSRVMHDDYDNPRFYVNNKLERALDIIQEIDEDF